MSIRWFLPRIPLWGYVVAFLSWLALTAAAASLDKADSFAGLFVKQLAATAAGVAFLIIGGGAVLQGYRLLKAKARLGPLTRELIADAHTDLSTIAGAVFSACKPTVPLLDQFEVDRYRPLFERRLNDDIDEALRLITDTLHNGAPALDTQRRQILRDNCRLALPQIQVVTDRLYSSLNDIVQFEAAVASAMLQNAIRLRLGVRKLERDLDNDEAGVLTTCISILDTCRVLSGALTKTFEMTEMLSGQSGDAVTDYVERTRYPGKDDPLGSLALMDIRMKLGLPDNG